MERDNEVNVSGTQIGSVPTPAASVSMQEVVPLQDPEMATSHDPSQESEDPSSIQEVLKRKPSRPPSDAWTHFTKENDRAICKYCKKSYACNTSSHGTSNMLKHLKVCSKNPHRVIDKKPKTIVLGKQCEDDGDTIGMKLAEFSQEQSRIALAKMIIVDELAFKFVGNEGFRGFMSVAQPRIKIPSRVTIAKDFMDLFNLEKEKLKSTLSENHQMVSLTTDTWTSIQNMNYMCVTAHYIDDEWKLNKKILSFGLISDHKGETIGKTLEKCLKDWGILKICCVTVDNASANNSAITYLARGISDWNGITLSNGEFMHMRCCAHILNLIVNEGLKEIDKSITRIRFACKYVKSSPARLATFKRCAHEANITSKAMLTLDVPTRWNSTYMMLDVAEKFEKAFHHLEYEDASYLIALDKEGGTPNVDDWSRARVFVKFLKIFYDATLSFSGPLNVTSNTFLNTISEIQMTLNEWRHSNDSGLQRMATNMKVKFDKYWESDGTVNYLLFVAIFLDPCYKLDYIEFCFDQMYGTDKCKEMLKKLKDLIYKLFAHYASMHPIPVDDADSSVLDINIDSQSQARPNDDKGARLADRYRLKVRQKQCEVKRNELERYLEDDVEDNTCFDILKWWKGKSMKYYVLSHMARDILAIPVSTVSSESAFSTGGRVLDSFRSSLYPNTVEALICSQNWLRTSNTTDLQTEMDEVEKIESELYGLTSEVAMNIE